MHQNEKQVRPIIVYSPDLPVIPHNQKWVMDTQPAPLCPPIVLDPQRSGDRRRLVRLLATIVWRVAQQQVAQRVVDSQNRES